MANEQVEAAALDVLVLDTNKATAEAAALDVLTLANKQNADVAAFDVLTIADKQNVDVAAFDVLVVAETDMKVGFGGFDVLVIATLIDPPATNGVTCGFFDIDVDIFRANDPPFGGGASHLNTLSEHWVDGTVSGRFNRFTRIQFNLAPLATQVIDLQTVLMQNGFQLGLEELRYLHIKTAATNPTNPITIEPDGTNGWVALLQAGTKINLAPGVDLPLVSPLDGSYPVSATNKRLLLTNTDGAATATIDLLIAGTDA